VEDSKNKQLKGDDNITTTTTAIVSRESWDQVAWFCLSAHQLPRRRKRQRDR
jgi:hypothetical protein